MLREDPGAQVPRRHGQLTESMSGEVLKRINGGITDIDTGWSNLGIDEG
jgi:hypothetical protein